MGFWAKSRLIFNSFRDHAKASIRQVAAQTGLSKSSVHRLGQAMARRGRHPESWLWETAEGRSWLIRLVVATLFIFGLKRGVGAETISEFFGRLRLEAHVGCSPSALRGVMQGLEGAILETTSTWEHDGVAHGEIRPIVGAVDETFLQRLMLVLVDLTSGYLLVEEVAGDRTYDTWHGLVKARLKTLGVGVLYLVSDRAKALVKLAQTGLECLSIPDLFHLLHDLVKSYSLAIFSRLRQAQQALTQARHCLAQCQASHAGEAEVQQAQAWVEACEAEVKHWHSVRSAYRDHLESLSLIMHPWRLLDSTRQSSEEVEGRLQAEIEALETLMETNGLPVKKKALDKVHKQLAGVSALVDFWWQSVGQDVQQVALSPTWTRWVEELLLPLMYWQEQLSRTRCPRRKAKIVQALEAVQDTFESHPCTGRLAPEVRAAWQAWAAEWAKAFQRASSAVEGRNGYLSQMHHNHRGLPKRRYQVWTVLHNFDCRASDGTTPASRFFRREFPDLFETVLSQIDDLPRPRRRNQALAISD
ncbi:MAG: DUF6399 domain-containing protein [Pseudomonadota bacterium]|nr:DUF6399 domain-containing protein [Pseudomonadota bacterium]